MGECTMLRLVFGIAVVSLGAVFLGAVVPGMFWLTLIGLAALLGACAVGLSLLDPLREDGDPAVSTPLTLMTSTQPLADTARIRRAA
jgi:hypothetical protein